MKRFIYKKRKSIAPFTFLVVILLSYPIILNADEEAEYLKNIQQIIKKAFIQMSETKRKKKEKTSNPKVKSHTRKKIIQKLANPILQFGRQHRIIEYNRPPNLQNTKINNTSPTFTNPEYSISAINPSIIKKALIENPSLNIFQPSSITFRKFLSKIESSKQHLIGDLDKTDKNIMENNNFILWFEETKNSALRFWLIFKSMFLDDPTIFEAFRNSQLCKNIAKDVTPDKILKLPPDPCSTWDYFNPLQTFKWSPTGTLCTQNCPYLLDQKTIFTCQQQPTLNIHMKNSLCTNLAQLATLGHCFFQYDCYTINNCFKSYVKKLPFYQQCALQYGLSIENITKTIKQYFYLANKIFTKQMLPIYLQLRELTIKNAEIIPDGDDKNSTLLYLLAEFAIQNYSWLWQLSQNFPHLYDILTIPVAIEGEQNFYDFLIKPLNCKLPDNVKRFLENTGKDLDEFEKLKKSLDKLKNNRKQYIEFIKTHLNNLFKIEQLHAKWLLDLKLLFLNSNSLCDFIIVTKISRFLKKFNPQILNINLTETLLLLDDERQKHAKNALNFTMLFESQDLFETIYTSPSPPDLPSFLQQLINEYLPTYDYRWTLIYLSYAMQMCNGTTKTIDDAICQLCHNKCDRNSICRNKLKCILENKGNIIQCPFLSLPLQQIIPEFEKLQTIQNLISEIKKIQNSPIYSISHQFQNCCLSCQSYPAECNKQEWQDICKIIEDKKQERFKFDRQELQNAGQICCTNGKILFSSEVINDKLIYDPQKKMFLSAQTQSPQCLFQKDTSLLTLLAEISQYIIEDEGKKFCTNPVTTINNLCCNASETCQPCSQKGISSASCQLSVPNFSTLNKKYINKIEERTEKFFTEYLIKKTKEFSEQQLTYPQNPSEYCDIIK